MKFRPENTLAHFNAAPQVRTHDLSELPVKVFSKAVADYRKDCGLASPNDSAVSFYTLNHCASIVRKVFTPNEPLPEWAQKIMVTYTDVCMAQGERMLHYILAICTREMRHLNSYGKNAQKFTVIEKAGGPVMKAFIEHIQSMDESKAVEHYQEHPPAATVGQYIAAMSAGFHKGGWEDSHGNTGYGGKKWGLVADAAVAMLHGATSMEMLVDTGYTLAHNGGPIFNKGMMYSGYDGAFMTILDVQRASQLPELMLATETLGIQKTADAVEAVALIQHNYPVDAKGDPTIKGFVDWALVDSLRPDKHAHPSKYKKVLGTAKAKAAVPVVSQTTMTTLLGQKVKMTGTWQVFPNQTVNVIERVK